MKATCSVPDCVRGAIARGYCRGHYDKTREPRTSDSDALPRERLNFHKLTRGACMRAEGPCDTQLCRFNVLGEHRSPRTPRGRERIQVIVEPCALKCANAGSSKLDEIGAALGITRERVRQVEQKALVKLRRRLRDLGITQADLLDVLASLARGGHPLAAPVD